MGRSPYRGATRKASGRRSGLEDRVAEDLEKYGAEFEYEPGAIRYSQPAMVRRYTPDFVLSNGIIIEAKGVFVSADRKKFKLVKECHPHLDIRFVFSRAATRLSKTSKTTYAKWADDHGFPWADGHVPLEWCQEPAQHVRLAALKGLMK